MPDFVFHRLADLAPEQTLFMLGVAPGVLLLLVGFTVRHVMDVASAKAWSR